MRRTARIRATSGGGYLKRLAVGANGFGHRCDMDEAEQQRVVEAGKLLTARDLGVLLTPQDIQLQRIAAPDPDLGDTELPVDLELVEPARGPDDLDRQVRPLRVGRGAPPRPSD